MHRQRNGFVQPIEPYIQMRSYRGLEDNSLFFVSISTLADLGGKQEFERGRVLLEIWYRIIHAAYGPQFRRLASTPRFKNGYMMFMCASSRHVCKRCFCLTGCGAGFLCKLPFPIPVLLPRRSTDGFKHVGEMFDPNWTIRICLLCLLATVYIH